MSDVWVSKARRTGRTSDFFEKGFITMGWPNLPDLSSLQSKAHLTKMYDEIYPGERKMQIAAHIGQIWKFYNDVKIGDIIIFPERQTSTVQVGIITGNYKFDHAHEVMRHNRTVKWIKVFPRSAFDSDLLYSFGSLLTFARCRKDKAFERITKMLEGKVTQVDIISSEYVDDDDTSVDLETDATNRIIKFIEQNFSGHPLTDIINDILIAKGYVTKVSPPGADGGVDIIAGPSPFGLGNPKIVVQVKSSSQTEDVKLIREMKGVMQDFNADYGILAVWGGLTRSAIKVSQQSFFKIRWWDQVEIVNQIMANYEKFSDEMKLKLPLKQIWTLVENTDDE